MGQLRGFCGEQVELAHQKLEEAQAKSDTRNVYLLAAPVATASLKRKGTKRVSKEERHKTQGLSKMFRPLIAFGLPLTLFRTTCFVNNIDIESTQLYQNLKKVISLVFVWTTVYHATSA
jgi:hypothetical protein